MRVCHLVSNAYRVRLDLFNIVLYVSTLYVTCHIIKLEYTWFSFKINSAVAPFLKSIFSDRWIWWQNFVSYFPSSRETKFNFPDKPVSNLTRQSIIWCVAGRLKSMMASLKHDCNLVNKLRVRLEPNSY